MRTDFKAGKQFVRLATDAIADGITAATLTAQALSTQGMFASGSILAVTSKRSGIAYYPGVGAPLGGYPKVRSGQLERSLGTERARVQGDGRVIGFLNASADYAYYVHGGESNPKRPFLTLPFDRNRPRIFDAFARAATRRLR